MRINILKNSRLRQKIIIPLLLVMMLLFTAIIIITIYSLKKTNNYNTEKFIETKILEVDHAVEDISNTALYIASISSEMQIVKNAYEEYYRTKDIEKASSIIDSQFHEINAIILKSSGYDARIHFHLPPAISFCRCWSKIRGDDISDFRNSVLQVSKNHSYVKGIETGRGGFVIRGIAPIFSETGNYYGSVEAFFNINILLKQISRNTEEDIAIFMNTDLLKIATNFLESSSTNIQLEEQIIDDYILVEKTENFRLENIISHKLNSSISANEIFQYNNYKYAVIPIKNVKGVVEGIGLLQIDLTDQQKSLSRIILFEAGAFFLLMIVVILLLTKLSNLLIVTEIVKTDKCLQKLAKGELIKKINISQNDEISSMQISLNKLNENITKNTKFAIEISNNNLEVNYEAISQTDLLGNSLLQMQKYLIEHRDDTKKTLDKLIQSKENFKKLSNLTFEGILIHDKGIAIDINHSFAKMFGYSRDEIIGNNIIDLLVPKKYHSLLAEKIMKQYAEPYEVEGRRKDGTVFPVELEAKNLETNEKNNTTRVAAIRDISLRKKAEKEITKLSMAVEQSANTIIITDTAGNIEYVNPKFTELTGYTIEEVRGKNSRILNAGTQAKEYYENLWKTISSGKIWNGEFHNKKKNGDYFWELVTITPLKNNAGKIVNYLAIKEDITKNKETAEQLRKQNVEFASLNEEYKTINEELIKAKERVEENERKLIEAQKIAHLGHWELDLLTNSLIWSDEVYRIFGLEPQEFTATYEAFLDNIHPDDRELVNNAYLDSLKTQNAYKVEHRLLLKSGELKYVQEQCKTDFDEEGIPVRSLGTVIDITAEKNHEIELIKAKERAEESDQLKTEFINNMSHEIRTPMNGIIGFSDFLNKPGLTDEKRKQYINIIQSSGNQLMRIIDDILEISRLGTKQISIEETQICLNNLLLEQFSIFDIKAKENLTPLYLKKGLSDEDSIILTDKTKLNKILNNLLENALRFTRQGFVEFGYQLKGNELEFYVKDTGIGIDPLKQVTIFERFSQAEKELSRKVGGLGLGLSIAKENAELLGGNISLQSEKGKGATFFVTIPYKPANTEIETNKNIISKHVKREEKNNNYTILIVEDEEVNYLYMETLLEYKIRFDCKIIHAKNGKEAVDICKKKPEIDFVLMDLKMPVMNGYEATKQIKKILPDVPIVAQTAYSTIEEREKAFSSGCDDFISKPISEAIFNSIINKYIFLK